MSMATVTSSPVSSPSNVRFVVGSVVADATYATGGYDVSAAIPAGGSVFVATSLRYVAGAGGGVVPVYNPVTKKIALFESTTGAPLALVECAASSAHVTAATIVDFIVVQAS